MRVRFQVPQVSEAKGSLYNLPGHDGDVANLEKKIGKQSGTRRTISPHKNRDSHEISNKLHFLPDFCLVLGAKYVHDPVAQANSALALSSMAEHDGVVYAAYRSFDLLRFSNKLQVVAYDLNTHKELRHVTISVPKVHGARASEGLFISKDGQTLAYAELHEPGLMLLLAAKNLTEIRRSTALPLTSQDHQRMFAGFDGNQLCMASDVFEYGKPELEGLRFIRLRVSDLKLASDTKISGLTQENSGSIVWLPPEKTTWVVRGHIWKQYTEAGQLTGQELEHENAISKGAIPLEETRLLAFYGRHEDGSVISYADRHERELKLRCAPHPYGTSTDPAYAGAICTTQRDILPEAGGDKIMTSEFLLFKVDGPTVVWRQKMNWLDVRNDAHGIDGGYQKGDPLIYHAGSKLLIVAPSKSPELKVYEVALSE